MIDPDLLWAQNGCENIIVDCLARTGVRNKTCCEFGAWDGMKFSNTAYFVRELGWQCLFIEAVEERAARCRAWYSRFPKTSVLCSPVTAENINALIPADLDLLSIDVDGNDYWLWKALETRPGLVVIEYNPRAHNRPYDPTFVRQEGDYGYGATEDMLVSLALQKGYERLASDGHCNLFFGAKERLT